MDWSLLEHHQETIRTSNLRANGDSFVNFRKALCRSGQREQLEHSYGIRSAAPSELSKVTSRLPTVEDSDPVHSDSSSGLPQI